MTSDRQLTRREFVSRMTAIAVAATVASGCTRDISQGLTTTSAGIGPTGLTAGGGADLVIANARVSTVDEANPRAQAVAITNGLLTFVGSDAAVKEHIGPTTEIVDLGGRGLLPGFHEPHAHILEAFSPVAGTCTLQAGTDAESYFDTFQTCAPNQIGTDWVIGWGHSVFDLYEVDRPPRLILDEGIPDRPAVMLEETSHSVWANSRALALAGIDETTPDPPGGIIVRDASGQPTGLLFDNAGDMVMEHAFKKTPELVDLHYQGLLLGLGELAKNGITSYADARVYWTRGHLEAWRRAEQNGRLSARTALGLWAYPQFDDDQQIEMLASMYSNDPTSRLRANQIKVYSDGITINGTAALLEPYEPGSTAVDVGIGLNYFAPDRLARYITELELVGFDFHIHAIGDRGVREALDAIEVAMENNGDSVERRHRLTHLELVHPEDRPRFAELGVIADFQAGADFAQPDQVAESARFVGDRAHDLMPVRDIWDAGAVVTLSSDYDVSDLNPLVSISRSVRRGPQSLPTITDAIRAHTLDGAYLMRQEDRTGSITVGKLADLVVLAEDPTAVPPEEVEHLSIDATLLEGSLEHGSL